MPHKRLHRDANIFHNLAEQIGEKPAGMTRNGWVATVWMTILKMRTALLNNAIQAYKWPNENRIRRRSPRRICDW